MSKIIKSIILIVLLLSLLVSSYYLANITVLNSRANNYITTFNPNNSYVFASPVAAKADDDQKIRITVFLLSNQGLPITGASVKLITSRQTVNVSQVSPQTDETGKAYFDLSSALAGPATIIAEVQNQSLPQKITISFY